MFMLPMEHGSGAWEFGVTRVRRAYGARRFKSGSNAFVQCIVVNEMNIAVRSLVVGAGVEVVVFLSVIPKDSLQPPTRNGAILAYTLLPGATAFRILFGTGFGHFLDSVPTPLNLCLAIAGFAAVAVFQAAFFAFPIWWILRWWSSRRQRLGVTSEP
jgi:hypothetical protein